MAARPPRTPVDATGPGTRVNARAPQGTSRPGGPPAAPCSAGPGAKPDARAGRRSGVSVHCGDFPFPPVWRDDRLVTESTMSSTRRLPPLRSLAAICALGGSLLLATACSSADTTRSSVAEAAPTGSPSTTGTGTASPTGTATSSPGGDRAERKALIPMAKITWDKAADTAMKEVPQSKLVELELQRTTKEAMSATGSPSPSTPNPAPSTGAPEWEAKVAAPDGTVHRIDIDAVSGKVFRTQVEPDQSAADKRDMADRLDKASQSPQQAVKAATDKTKGTVTGLDLDENDQQLQWTVDVVNTDTWDLTAVDVDATNGKVLGEKVTDD